MAERGEFTYRAVMCGRINLIQAESILSLVSSENELTAQMALRQLRGELSAELNSIKDNLSWALSRLEANIDFAAEFIEFAAQEAIVNKLQAAHAQTKRLLDSYRAGQILQNGVQVAIVGAPNVGKSSLLNALAKEERAIVSPIAGTTRDRVEADIMVAGRKVKFIDTAGLRDTEDQIENIGIGRTKKTIEDADIVLLVYDRTDKNTRTDLLRTNVKEKRSLYIGNKSDLVSGEESAPISAQEIYISTQTKAGLDKLISEIEKYMSGFSVDTGSAVLHTRQYESLIKVCGAIGRGLSLLIENASPEFVISELNEAYVETLKLTGEEFDDQILDRVFKEFCLGK
jgi:tRNA modification GTPase